MFSAIIRYFKPDPHIARHDDNTIKEKYPKFRWAILESSFIGYALFYLVRNNVSPVAKEMQDVLGYNYSMIGDILLVGSLAYGFGKFFMGALSDRSNPRKFMAVFLALTALCNFAFGAAQIYWVHLVLWGLNGLAQGAGWAPCARSIGHWYSLKERGTVFAVWNIAHNIGGGIAGIIAAKATIHFGWEYAFYFPGAIALVGSIYLFTRLKDTPQSLGLPPIEEYKHDFSENEYVPTHERELSTRELLIDNIFKNKWLWVFASANFFVYIVRYSMLDWGPLYLRDVKGATISDGGIAIFLIEFGGIPSILFFGWLSDKWDGRRGMVSFLCMVPILFAFMGLIYTPKGYLWLDMTLLCIIGFFVYPPVMLLGIAGLDLTSKKAVGAAAGFIGLFGYCGRAFQAKGSGWLIEHYKDSMGIEAAWSIVLHSIAGCALMAILLLTLTWKIRPKA